MKKLIGMFLAAAMAAICAQADTWTDPDTGYTWTYYIDGNTATIESDKWEHPAAISPDPTGDMTIPAMLGGYPVTSIGGSAFKWCDNLKTVTIPDSVTSIGRDAFHCCPGLTSVTIGNGVKSIGQWAFYCCSELTSMTIPNSVTNIGYGAFDGCTGLTSVTIGNGVTSIGSEAFYGCSGLTSVTIGNGVKSIGDSAFWGCIGLTSITIPNSVTRIEWGAFSYCSGLTSVTIPQCVCSSGLAFVFPAAYKSITNIVILNGVTSIGGKAFCDCSGLTSIKIPGSVTYIGAKAFCGCSGLTSVTIPSSVTSIGYDAFCGCSGLTSVTIGNGVKSIGDDAFCGCSGLTSVTIPSSVTSVGDYAFSGCTRLKFMTFMGNAPEIGRAAFNKVAKGFVVRVRPGSTGWGVNIPGTWNGLQVEYIKGYKRTLKAKADNAKYGTVTGGGIYEAGAPATLKAKAKKGYAFAGWFTNKACTNPLNPRGYDNRKPTVKVAMPGKNTTVYAKFISKKAAKESLKFSSATKKLAKTPTKVQSGDSLSLRLGISSATITKVTVKGLPKGMSIDKTTGMISGTPTDVGTYTVKVTVKDAAGNKITLKLKIRVTYRIVRW